MEQKKTHSYIRFLILILAIAGMVAFLCLFVSPDSLTFRKQSAEVAADPALIALREQLASGHTIIHAGGALIDSEGNSHPYTNALETLPLAYEAGNRFIELDFAYTTDGKAVCLHKWADGFYPNQKDKNESDGEPVQMSYDQFRDALGRLKGVGPGTINAVLSGFSEYREDIQIALNCLRIIPTSSSQFQKPKAVITGVRDERLIEAINNAGFDCQDTYGVTKDTALLICESYASNSGKMQKAKKYGIRMLSIQDFLSEYHITL